MPNCGTLCISNRQLLTGSSDYNPSVRAQILERISLIASEHLADALILREKDLTWDQYKDLAEAVNSLCSSFDFPLILHHFVETAGVFTPALPLHLSVPDFLSLKEKEAAGLLSENSYTILGVSTHTVEEAVQAEKLGASYITASHIFPTECKKGLEPRGLHYLKEVCKAVSIPVYALGGIHNKDQIDACMYAGASGVCMMSEYFGPVLDPSKMDLFRVTENVMVKENEEIKENEKVKENGYESIK